MNLLYKGEDVIPKSLVGNIDAAILITERKALAFTKDFIDVQICDTFLPGYYFFWECPCGIVLVLLWIFLHHLEWFI